MKSTQILAALDIKEVCNAKKHCSYLANIFKMVKENSKYISNVKEDAVKTMMFGQYESSYNYAASGGVEILAKTIEIDFVFSPTNSAKYRVEVPINNAFYTEFANLLGLQVTEQKEINNVEKTFIVPFEVLAKIIKAKKFVSKDDLRPAMTGVFLEFENETIKVVATDAHKLYKSNSFEAICEDYKMIIAPESFAALANIKDNKGDLVIEILKGTQFALLNGVKVELINARFPDYKSVTPTYESKMIFDKKALIKLCNEVGTAANKATHQINFHLNGTIAAMAQDVFFSFQSENSIPYISKDFKDCDISFNGKMLVDCLKTFEAKELDFCHDGEITDKRMGCITKAAILTDGADSVLLMPLQITK